MKLVKQIELVDHDDHAKMVYNEWYMKFEADAASGSWE